MLQPGGSLYIFGEMFLDAEATEISHTNETLLCPGLRKRSLFSGKGVKHIQLPFFYSTQSRIIYLLVHTKSVCNLAFLLHVFICAK